MKSPTRLPAIVDMRVVPVAGQDSMLLNLSGAHAPYFTRNVVVLRDADGVVGVGEVPGGEPIRKTLQDAAVLVRGSLVGQHATVMAQIQQMKQMGGLGSMAKAYGSKWIWSRFWEMTAFLSMALAFLNILPIPALDGGHVVFLLYEWVARRPANPKVLEYAQMAGMVFLLTVIVAVNGHDLFKMITGQL